LASALALLAGAVEAQTRPNILVIFGEPGKSLGLCSDF
jgi:hypothetical protein